MLKLLVVSCLALSTVSTFASGGDIDPVKQIRNEVQDLVKDFKLEDQGLTTGAPEYGAISEKFIVRLDQLKNELDASLTDINNELSRDYSLLLSLKKISKKDEATKKTIKLAEERLKAKAKSITSSKYHAPILNLITVKNEFTAFASQCLSALCVNKVQVDFVRWSKLAKRVNIDLDLEVTKMEKASNLSQVLKNHSATLSSQAAGINSRLPVSITDEEYNEHLDKIARQKEEQRKKDEAANNPVVNTEIAEGCAKTEVIDSVLMRCVDPFLLENNKRLAIPVTAFTPALHAKLCGSEKKLPLAGGTVGWNYDNMNAFVGDQHQVKSVICQATTPGLSARLIVGPKTDMAGNVTRIDGIQIRFAEFNSRFAAGITGNVDRANAFCRMLGHASAYAPTTWSTAGDADRCPSCRYTVRKNVSIKADGTLERTTDGSIISIALCNH